MTNKHAVRGCLLILSGIVLCISSLKAAPNRVLRLIQTNSAGDNVDVIDPATNKVVGEIKGIEVSHGVGVSPDGSRIYVSDEAMSTLDVADARSLKVIKQIRLSGRPNNITVTPDGSRVYIAINQMPGGVDVIDTASLTNIKTVKTGYREHNPYVTPDGKFVVAGSSGASVVSVIDTRSNEVAWSVTLDQGIRPMTMSKNPDGSTKYLFVQLGDFNGFAVIDFASREEIKRIKHPELPSGKPTVPDGDGVSHGMAVTPDQKLLVVDSRLNNMLYVYSLPEVKYVGGAELGGKGAAWVSLAPDGKTAYVANAVTNDVSVVDIKSLKEIARINVGFVPKRNTTAMLQN